MPLPGLPGALLLIQEPTAHPPPLSLERSPKQGKRSAPHRYRRVSLHAYVLSIDGVSAATVPYSGAGGFFPWFSSRRFWIKV